MPTEQITISSQANGINMEMYYQFDSKEVQLDPSGTYFGSDFVGKGSGPIIVAGAYDYEAAGGNTCALSQQSALECDATTLANSRTRAIKFSGIYAFNAEFMAIANGLINRPIQKILSKNICTWFLPKISKLDARKKWIISSISPKGQLIIDEGAITALKKGKSLLAAGIIDVKGEFNKGDHVKILNKNLREYARGLSSFTSSEILKIKGKHSDKIESLLLVPLEN